jgi:hypothetical protein
LGLPAAYFYAALISFLTLPVILAFPEHLSSG